MNVSLHRESPSALVDARNVVLPFTMFKLGRCRPVRADMPDVERQMGDAARATERRS